MDAQQHALVQLNDHEAERLSHCERIVERGLNSFVTVGLALSEINEARLYRATHGTFEEYVRERWHHGREHAYRLMRAAATAKQLRDINVAPGPHSEVAEYAEPTSEKQMRVLAVLPRDLQGDAWVAACKSAGGQSPTVAQVQAAVDTVRGRSAKPVTGHVLGSSASDEWYTPAVYLEAAHEVMGGIDLDPASCGVANELVRAAGYYVRNEDGLKKPWYGRVWLNPPYDKAGGAWSWVRKMCTAYRDKDVGQGIALVSAYTGVAAFAEVWRTADAVCFPGHRIAFLDAEGHQQNQPTKHNVFVYWGAAAERFCDVYRRFGACLELADVWLPDSVAESSDGA